MKTAINIALGITIVRFLFVYSKEEEIKEYHKQRNEQFGIDWTWKKPESLYELLFQYQQSEPIKKVGNQCFQ